MVHDSQLSLIDYTIHNSVYMVLLSTYSTFGFHSNGKQHGGLKCMAGHLFKQFTFSLFTSSILKSEALKNMPRILSLSVVYLWSWCLTFFFCVWTKVFLGSWVANCVTYNQLRKHQQQTLQEMYRCIQVRVDNTDK